MKSWSQTPESSTSI
jgi:transposase